MIRYVAIRMLILSGLLPLIGCRHFHDLNSEDRLQRGLTLVLPGIESASVFNSNVAQGLDEGGVETAIVIHDWTTGRVWNFLTHLCNIDRNRQQAQFLAQRIVEYQNRYPGRPVNLIGHSGGGALTLMTLEALPPDRKINAAILLAPAISPRYDLSTALSKTEAGIWNYYSPFDAFFLGASTLVLGTIDRRHTISAGAKGFRIPDRLSATEAELYNRQLHQVPFSLRMISSGNLGGHFGATSVKFSRNYLAPVVRSQPCL